MISLQLLSPGITVLLIASLHAQQQIVQPARYRSPSGELELFVDPSRRNGSGPGHYRMTCGAEVRWTAELPFTLRDALVRDDGVVAGFAYPDRDASTELLVAVLAPDGSVRGAERVERSTRLMHAVPFPSADELRSNGPTFALEVPGTTRGGDCWWLYDWNCKRAGEVANALFLEERAPETRVEADPEPDTFPALELVARGRVGFPWPVPVRAPSEAPPEDELFQRCPHRVFVDGAGRIWIAELSARIVHAFDEHGAALRECTRAPATFRPYHMAEWLAVRGDGSLFAAADGAVEEFDPEGASVGRLVELRREPGQWLFQPGRSERWEVTSDALSLVGATGEALVNAARGANGRWFQTLSAAGVAPDGGLAVLDDPSSVTSREPSTWVHLFDARAQPLRSLRVPDRFSSCKLAYDGRRVALLLGRVLLVLAADGTPLGRATLSAELGEPYHVFFSPAGELWIFPHYRAEMFRFALPE